MSSREALARLIWAEIAGSDQRQQDVAATVGITQKHLSQTINGRTGMQLDMVDRVLAACGRRLVFATEPLTEGRDAAGYARAWAAGYGQGRDDEAAGEDLDPRAAITSA